jgi:hypothetical protein
VNSNEIQKKNLETQMQTYCPCRWTRVVGFELMWSDLAKIWNGFDRILCIQKAVRCATQMLARPAFHNVAVQLSKSERPRGVPLNWPLFRATSTIWVLS